MSRQVSRRQFGMMAGAGALLLPDAVRAAGAATRPIRKVQAPRRAKHVEHGIVYRREGEFASHPYVRGFWETAAGHLICNFSVATVDYTGDPNRLAHTSLVTGPGGRRGATVRSEDRGRTWTVSNEDKNRPSVDVMAPRPGIDGRPGPISEIGPVDFLDRDVLVSNFNYMYMRQDPLIRDFFNDVSRVVEAPDRNVFFRVSKDAGRSWSRCAPVPLEGLYSLAGTESATVRPDGRCLLFLNGTARQGAAGGGNRPLVYRSTDDGTSFHFLSFIIPKDESRYGGMTVMYPRGLMLPSGRLLASLRVDREWAGDMWTEVHFSDDGGGTWQFLSRVGDFGAPCAPLRLRDGRLVMICGNRLPPAGIRAIVSEDEGRTWGPEISVREDAGSWDIGYPRAWEVSPGRVGVVYYYNTNDDPVQLKATNPRQPWGAGGTRFIARSFFSVD